jgi:hypothetical protein
MAGQLLSVMQIDLAELPSDPALLQQVVRELAAALATRDAEVERLRTLLRQLQRAQLGRRSEQLIDPEQLQLGLEDLEQAVAAAEAAAEKGDATLQASRRRTRRVNRGALPGHLPRIEVVIDVEDKTCPCCGGVLHLIGEDRSEMLDAVPAQLRVKVIRRPRYGCRACEAAVVQAPAPARPIDGGPPRPPGRVRFVNWIDRLLAIDGDRGARRAGAGEQVRRSSAALSSGPDPRPPLQGRRRDPDPFGPDRSLCDRWPRARPLDH